MTDVNTHQTTGDTRLLTLENEHLSLAVTPELGARVTSLLDRARNREWLWAADRTRPMRPNAVGDPFDDSPLLGIDECLPTVGPCTADGHPMPDHGEVWTRPWTTDDDALADNRIVTSIQLDTRPLRLTRTITVDGPRATFEYELHHTGDADTTYIWSIHPLFATRPGDHVDLASTPITGRVNGALNMPGVESCAATQWPDAGSDHYRLDHLDLGPNDNTAIKLFVPTQPGATATVRNQHDGTALRLTYGPTDHLPFLGVWINRGGWNGFEHFAVEPTNADHDSLNEAKGPATQLSPGESRRWWVTLDVNPD